jgi:hypothetical protein
VAISLSTMRAIAFKTGGSFVAVKHHLLSYKQVVPLELFQDRRNDNSIEKRGGLNNTAYDINNQQKITVTFFVGSITYDPGCRIVYFLLNK